MIICQNCRFWIDDKPDYDRVMHPQDQDTFEEIKMPFEIRKCLCPNITLFERNPNTNGVSLCDGEDYRAVMYTGPDFGCINGMSNES